MNWKIKLCGIVAASMALVYLSVGTVAGWYGMNEAMMSCYALGFVNIIVVVLIERYER